MEGGDWAGVPGPEDELVRQPLVRSKVSCTALGDRGSCGEMLNLFSLNCPIGVKSPGVLELGEESYEKKLPQLGRVGRVMIGIGATAA